MKKFKILAVAILMFLLMGAAGKCSCSTPFSGKNSLESSSDIVYNGLAEDKPFHLRKYLADDKMDFLMKDSNETEAERIERLALRGYGSVATYTSIKTANYDSKTKAEETVVEYSAPNFNEFYAIVLKNLADEKYKHKSDTQITEDIVEILLSLEATEVKSFKLKFEPNPNKYQKNSDGKLVEVATEPWLLWLNPEDVITSFKKQIKIHV